MINIPLPEQAWSGATKDQQQSATKSVDNDQLLEEDGGGEMWEEDTMTETSERMRQIVLEPPSALFNPIDYPPLHIFVSSHHLKTLL